MTSLVENPESTGAAEDLAPPVGIIGDGAPVTADATVPLFKVAMAESAPDAVAAVLRSGYIGQGPKVEELEARLVEIVGNPRSMTVNSATSGLHLALHLMRGVTAADGRAALADGDEVLASPLTCTATNWPILANRLRIKWVDVDPANCNIDLDDLEAKITPTTRAVMLVHWGGYPVDLERLDGVLDRAQERFGFRPVVVEDCAHAWGSTYHGTHLGTHGNAAVFSFQAIKHFTSGDGGLLAVPDEDLYRRGKLLRWYGIDREGERADFRCEADVTEFGFKFHMNDINAAIGLANLDIIDSVVGRHQANAAAYDEAFDGVDGVRLMERAPDRTSASWLYTLAVERRDDFMRMMAGHNIAVSRVHERNDIHSTVAEFTTELPRLDALVAEMICIPVGWWVAPDQRDRVIDAVRSGWQMLHVATVHWQEPRWIEPQLRFMARNLPEHRVYASLNGIDPDEYGARFHWFEDMPGDHHVKLNALAAVISEQAGPDDLLLFIDSDAFPIAPVDGTLLGDTPLAAVRRDENAAEPIPHPCFCLTTVGFWNEIDGDWGLGNYHWTAPTGDVISDGGANLLAILEERRIAWTPLLRSNRHELHPLWFGVYGDVVYHHGAGSRPARSFRDTTEAAESVRAARDKALIPAGVPVLGRLERSLRYRREKERSEVRLVAIENETRALSESIVEQILTDDEFYRQFTDAPATG